MQSTTPANKLQHLTDKATLLNEYIGRGLAWLTLLMVLTTFLIVVLRYGFNIGQIAMQESVIYMHAMVFMLAAAYTFKHDGHVRVDVLYRKFSVKRKALVDLCGNILLLIPVSLFIFFSSLEYVGLAWKLKEGSPEPGGLAYIYLLKTCIPLSALLLLLQAVISSLQQLMILTSKDLS